MPDTPTAGHGLARPLDGENPGAAVLNSNWDKIDVLLVGKGITFPSSYPVGGLFLREDQSKLYQNTGTLGTPAWTVRLSDAAAGPPAAHGPSHEDGGTDEFNVDGLAGTLAQAQIPAAHAHDPAEISPQGHTSGLDADAVDGIEGAELIQRDGSVPFTENQSMGGKRLTDLPASVDPNDAVRKAELSLSNPPVGHSFHGRLSFVSTTFLTVGTAGKKSGFRDSTDSQDIEFTGTLSIDATTVGAGGLDAGALAPSLHYAVFVIADSNGVNPVKALMSTSFASPTLPTGYDRFRRVGVARTNAGSALLKFQQSGNGNDRTYQYIEAQSVIQVVAGAGATSWTGLPLSSLIPSTSQMAMLAVTLAAKAAGTRSIRFRPTGTTVAEIDSPWDLQTPRAGADSDHQFPPFLMPTDPSQSVDYAQDVADASGDVYVVGFVDEI